MTRQEIKVENNENNKTTNRGKMRRPPSRKGGDKRKFTEKTPERAPVLKNVKRVKRKIPPVRIEIGRAHV